MQGGRHIRSSSSNRYQQNPQIIRQNQIVNNQERNPQIQLIDSLLHNQLFQQPQYQKPRQPIKQEIRSNSSNGNQKYDITSRVNIQPIMIIWLRSTMKLEELEKQYSVQVVYDPKFISLKGGHFNVTHTKKEIELLANTDYTMDYLYKSEFFKQEDLVPYDEILINEHFMGLIKIYSNLCLMNKNKLKKLMGNLSDEKNYTGCDDQFQLMPKSFVIIFCRKVDKEEVTRKIEQIIGIIKNRLDNNITSQQSDTGDTRGLNLVNLGVYNLVSLIYTVQKMDLIWINLFLDIKELSRIVEVHVNFTDHETNDSLVFFSVNSSHKKNYWNMVKFILYFNLSLWVMVKFLIQNFDESLVTQLDKYNKQNFPDHEIYIYQEDQVFQAAQSMDQIYSTSVTQYLSKITPKQNGQIQYLKKVKERFLFMLTEKTIKDDLSKNVQDFLESKQVQHFSSILDETQNMTQVKNRSSIVNKTQNMTQIQQLSSILNETQNMSDASSVNHIIRSLRQGLSLSQLSINQSKYTESLVYSEMSQNSIFQIDSQFQQ